MPPPFTDPVFTDKPNWEMVTAVAALCTTNVTILIHETGALRNGFPVVAQLRGFCILCMTGTIVLSKLSDDWPDFLNKLSWENRLLGAR